MKGTPCSSFNWNTAEVHRGSHLYELWRRCEFRGNTRCAVPFVCVTGQHPDLIQVFLEQLHVTVDANLRTFKEQQGLAELSARITSSAAKLLAVLQPVITLVQGDTTSAFAIAYASFLAHVPVAHVEAGLRTYDLSSPFPEELNRQMISALASLHFTPTSGATASLLHEGFRRAAIVESGNTVIDSILAALQDQDKVAAAGRALGAKVLETVTESTTTRPLSLNNDDLRRIVLLTAHRRENYR